jgi:Bardet-Biedl syndrome 2 protein
MMCLSCVCVCQALLSALKEVNHMIQKAARLRVGAPKTAVINACRDAVKSNQMSLVLDIIRNGPA